MKIETNKTYRAKFSNALTEVDEIVEVEKIISGLTGMEVKLKGHDNPMIACGFVNMFEAV